MRFSYLSDAVELWSIEPTRNAPTQRVINQLLDEGRAQLSTCRRIWWNTQHTTCIEHQWVLISRNGSVAPIVERVPEAKQIVQAIYEPGTEQLRMQFSDGTTAERIGT